MPHRDFFACLRESDQDFYDRSGWVHQKGAAIYLPEDDISVLPYKSQWISSADPDLCIVHGQWLLLNGHMCYIYEDFIKSEIIAPLDFTFCFIQSTRCTVILFLDSRAIFMETLSI